MTWAPSEDSDQPGHPPSLISVFPKCMKKPCVSHKAHREDWSLCGYPGWSKSSLGAKVILLVLLCGGGLNYGFEENAIIYEQQHDKTNKVSVHPAKTQISLGIRLVWSESSLCAHGVAKGPRFLHADSKDSDQTGRMPRLIWVFAGRTLILLVLSWGGSYNDAGVAVI